MKKYLIIFFLFVLVFNSCKEEVKIPKKPDFLIGNWIRLQQADSLKTYEKWKSDFTGIGITLKQQDTTFFEKLAIVTQNDSLFLRVTGVNEKPTFFYLTHQTDTSFVCENPKNEFPKKITYWFTNSQLHAAVSSEEFKINFVFDKIK